MISLSDWIAFAAVLVAVVVPLCVSAWHLGRIDQSVKAMGTGFRRLVSTSRNHENRIADLETRRSA